MTENNDAILKLIDDLFPDAEMLDVEQVRQLMQAHASEMGSGRKAAASVGASAPYWLCALTGKQLPGKKIALGYRLEHVDMYRIVRD
jgi:hypothetical protein